MNEYGSTGEEKNIYATDPLSGKLVPFPKEKIKRLKPEPTPAKPHTTRARDAKWQWSGNSRGDTANTGIMVPQKLSLEKLEAIVPKSDKKIKR